MKRIGAIFTISIVTLLLAGYSPSVEGKGGDAKEIHAILRLWVYAPPGAKTGVMTCPVCNGSVITNGVEEPRGVDVLNAAIYNKIGQFKSCKFLSPPEENRKGYALDIEENRRLIKKMAESMGADAILYPVLLRFRERVGNKYAASSPASVAFHLHLIESGSFKNLWEAKFAEEQQPLSNNLLKAKKAWKRKVEWVTADRLIQDGLAQAFESFPVCSGKTP